MRKADIKGMTLKELEIFIQNIGGQKFRAKQIFEWMHKGICQFDQMSNLPLPLREKLKESAFVMQIEPQQIQVSKKDGTRKYLFALNDGNMIESVLMQYKHGYTACISTQAGCRMGCTFCASGLYGLTRNLEPSEILDQILVMEGETNQKVSNVVVMGTGEPFDNYDNLARFLELVNAKEGLNIGMRSITVSTCGLLPKIKKFAREFPQVNLAISLHASNDDMRRKLMPVHKGYTLDELITVCREHVEQTGRRITFEYALIGGMNDNVVHAKELVNKIRGILCHVNLIPLNSVIEKSYNGSKKEVAEAFKKVLDDIGIPCTIRREMGSDIDGACGQLRLGQIE